MATTPNFNWSTPDNTGLVKNGALDIRTLGNSIDASMADLKGGTTGQVLAKASNTDMDFVWAADAGAPTSLGYSAGKNQVINGAFDVWQRGTTFTVTGTESVAYKADRWAIQSDGSTTTRTVSRQAFTPGTAPVAGYEGNYFLRFAQTTAGNNSYNFLSTRIENVTTFAGQTVTLSFWAKADSARTVSTYLSQNFGSGGSSSVNTSSQNNSLTTSWQRFTYTLTVPSLTGKTIGTSSFLEPTFGLPSGNITPTIDIWGVQLEAGSVATAFQTATGTIQGELSACQRYYQQVINGINQNIGVGWNYSTSYAMAILYLPVVMRTAPTIAVTSGTDYYFFERGGGTDLVNAFFGAANTNPNNTITLRNSTEVSGTAGQAGLFFGNNASSNISLSAEL